MTEQSLVPVERIERAIIVLRGQKVILDEYLAPLYEVEVKVLNQAVKRNIERFPKDFMFQLTPAEANRLRSQIVTLDRGRGLPLILEKAPLAEFEDVTGIFIARFSRTKGTTQETTETTQETTQDKILVLLRAHPELTRKLLAIHLAISEDGIKYHLAKLKEAGRIRHVGATKAGHWEVLP